MKTLILILLLIPIFSYTQEVGSVLTEENKKTLLKSEYDHCNKYMFISYDSSVVYKTRKADDLIWDIDYVLSQEIVEKNGLIWLIKYNQIGQNIFYNNGTYYFILFTGTHYLIQVRNASTVWPRRSKKSLPKEYIKTDPILVG